MGENAEGDQVKENLIQLRCHFTWGLLLEDIDIPDLQRRISNIKDTVGMLNLRAYVKHLKGQHEEALQSLKAAEALIQGEQVGKRSLVTWGNCAWVHYHMAALQKPRPTWIRWRTIARNCAVPSTIVWSVLRFSVRKPGPC